MKTLYEKLLPEAKSGLKSNEAEYRASVSCVNAALKGNHSWLELTVGQVHSLVMFSDMPWGKITKDTFQFGVNLIDQENEK